jgi:hypothetical protein
VVEFTLTAKKWTIEFKTSWLPANDLIVTQQTPAPCILFKAKEFDRVGTVLE